MYVDQAVTFKRRLVRKLMNVRIPLKDLYNYFLTSRMRLISAHGLVVGCGRLQLGGIGIDLDKWRPVKGADRPTTFMLAARMLRQKGVVEFCEAAKLVKEQHPEAVCATWRCGQQSDPYPDEINQWVSRGIDKWPSLSTRPSG